MTPSHSQRDAQIYWPPTVGEVQGLAGNLQGVPAIGDVAAVRFLKDDVVVVQPNVPCGVFSGETSTRRFRDVVDMVIESEEVVLDFSDQSGSRKDMKEVLVALMGHRRKAEKESSLVVVDPTGYFKKAIVDTYHLHDVSFFSTIEDAISSFDVHLESIDSNAAQSFWDIEAVALVREWQKELDSLHKPSVLRSVRPVLQGPLMDIQFVRGEVSISFHESSLDQGGIPESGEQVRALKRELKVLEDEGRDVVFDMTGLNYIGADGIGALIAFSKCGSGHVTLTHVCDAIFKKIEGYGVVGPFISIDQNG